MAISAVERDTRVGPTSMQTTSQPSLRILAVIETIGIGGGTEQLLLTLLPELAALGHRPEIVALSAWAPDLGPEFAHHGIPVHFLHKPERSAFPGSVPGLRKIIAGARYDIVWSHSRIASMAARLACVGRDVVQVATLHSEGYAQARLPLLARVTTALEKLLLTQPVKIAVSAAVARDYENFFGWRNLGIIHNCIDIRSLPPELSAQEKAALRAQYGAGPDDFVLVVPARFVQKKGHPVLVEALARLKTARGWSPLVLCFGYGPVKDEIERSVARQGLRVRICESIRQQDLFRVIRAADGVVLPSLREPFGIAALEAMSLGTPLIASFVDGLREIVEGRDCALTAPPGDAGALADAIWELHRNLGDAARRRVSALDVARDYLSDAAARRWSALFQKLTKSRAKPETAFALPRSAARGRVRDPKEPT